jgi:hypothetical protein
MAIEIFFSYAHEDEMLMDSVRRQLVIFERQGRIVKWHDREIPPGVEWEAQIDQRLRSAHVILLFVSPAFIESRYCYDVEVVAALERHAAGSARVIPIILRPCAWEAAPFAALQALPTDGKPLTQWPDRDQVCLDIARSIIAVADQLAANETQASVVGPNGAPPNTKPRKGRRKLFPGDRIPRIVVDFEPPRGINIPPGFQPRLTQIAARIVRESAVRDPSGHYSYPAQFRGNERDAEVFVSMLTERGGATDLGVDSSEELTEIWFEYSGELAPDAMKELARNSNLEVVHCGVWLIG